LPKSGLALLQTYRKGQKGVSICQGTVVKKNRVLTASHCTTNATKIEVAFYPFTKFQESLVASKGDVTVEGQDWAILSVPTQDEHVWTLATKPPAEFLDRLFATFIKWDDGVVVASPLYFLVARHGFGVAYKGDSGTAIINEDGQIIGVLTHIYQLLPFFQYTTTSTFKEYVK
jgi:S1-C subfamily serine protease